MKYEFASLRGPNLKIDVPNGTNWEEAFQILTNQDEEGIVWRAFDSFRNQHAIKHEGFTFGSQELPVAYKII